MRGDDQIRTGDQAFAELCLTPWPRRRVARIILAGTALRQGQESGLSGTGRHLECAPNVGSVHAAMMQEPLASGPTGTRSGDLFPGGAGGTFFLNVVRRRQRKPHPQPPLRSGRGGIYGTIVPPSPEWRGAGGEVAVRATNEGHLVDLMRLLCKRKTPSPCAHAPESAQSLL